MNIVGCEFLSPPILRLISISNIFSPDNPTFQIKIFPKPIYLPTEFLFLFSIIISQSQAPTYKYFHETNIPNASPVCRRIRYEAFKWRTR